MRHGFNITKADGVEAVHALCFQCFNIRELRFTHPATGPWFPVAPAPFPPGDSVRGWRASCHGG